MKTLMNYGDSARGFNRNAKLFLLHTVLSGLSIALLGLLYNLYVLSLDFKQDTIGAITLVACVVASAAALPMSAVLHRFGYQRALILAVILTAFSMWLPLAFPVWEMLFVCELFWGVGFTLLVIAGAPFMTENSTDGQRAQLFSLQFALTMLTAFAGYWIGGMLPGWFGEWFGVSGDAPQAYRAALSVSAGLMVLSAAPFLFIRPVGREKHLAPVKPRWMVRQPKPVAALLAPYIIGAIGAGMFVPFANVLWKTTQGASDEQVGNIFALSALLMVAAGIASPALVKRLGQVRAMLALQITATVGLLAFGFAPLLGAALVGYLARDVLMNLMRPIYGQYMMEHCDAVERATVSALATMGFNLAWGIGSWVSGIWQTGEQAAIVFISSAAFSALAAGAMYALYERNARAADLKEITHPVGVPAE